VKIYDYRTRQRVGVDPRTRTADTALEYQEGGWVLAYRTEEELRKDKEFYETT
jgi:exoribonuclease II